MDEHPPAAINTSLLDQILDSVVGKKPCWCCCDRCWQETTLTVTSTRIAIRKATEHAL